QVPCPLRRPEWAFFASQFQRTAPTRGWLCAGAVPLRRPRYSKYREKVATTMRDGAVALLCACPNWDGASGSSAASNDPPENLIAKLIFRAGTDGAVPA